MTEQTTHPSPPTTLINAAITQLRDIGLIGPDQTPPWRVLGGGVSNWVILFDCPSPRSPAGVVVKGALARLNVRDEWLADPTRAVFEGRAMLALGSRLPAGQLPDVLFIDEAHFLVGMSCAPAGAFPWKEALLRGEVDLAVAAQVGHLLGLMHHAAWQDSALAQQFGDLTLFRQLRLDPYYERAAQVAEQRGDNDLAMSLRAGATEMTTGQLTLVHGDFSPKNLLVHAQGVLVLDFEVVHWGNPDFDTAFLLTHLAMKAAHYPTAVALYAQAADIFFTEYAAEFSARGRTAIVQGALRQAGCLLIARVDGKSPAEYLTEPEKQRTRAAGIGILRGQIADLATLFTTIATAEQTA